MSFFPKIGTIWSEGGETLGGNASDRIGYVSDAIDKLDVEVLSSDQLVNIAFTLVSLVAYYIVSDLDCQIETNTVNHVGGDLIILEAGVPLSWTNQCQQSKHFTQDVTKMYLTAANPTTDNPVVQIRVARDATP